MKGTIIVCFPGRRSNWSGLYSLAMGTVCSEPRAQGYGLLGLAADGVHILVDYTIPLKYLLCSVVRQECIYWVQAGFD